MTKIWNLSWNVENDGFDTKHLIAVMVRTFMTQFNNMAIKNEMGCSIPKSYHEKIADKVVEEVLHVLPCNQRKEMSRSFFKRKLIKLLSRLRFDQILRSV